MVVVLARVLRYIKVRNERGRGGGWEGGGRRERVRVSLSLSLPLFVNALFIDSNFG
jgi:hypothetical protein